VQGNLEEAQARLSMKSNEYFKVLEEIRLAENKLNSYEELDG